MNLLTIGVYQEESICLSIGLLKINKNWTITYRILNLSAIFPFLLQIEAFLRALLTILSLVFVLTAFGHTNGSSNEKCKEKQNQPKKEKVGTLPAQLNFYEEDALKQESMDIEQQQTPLVNPVEVDSTSSSVTKYNYLFYFIYKYKFENKLGVDQIERLITD